MIPEGLLQRELFSYIAAQSLGITSRDLDEAVRRRLVARIVRGWYCKYPLPQAPETAHRLRTLAALADHRDLMAGFGSALVLRGLPVTVQAIKRVRLVHCGSGKPYVLPQISVHACPEGLALNHGEQSVSDAAACVQAALIDPATGLMAADQALRQNLFERSELASALACYQSARGVIRARAVLRLANPIRESPRESELAWLAYQLGLDLEEQVTVQGKSGRWYRADARVRNTRRLIEYDGRDKYRSQQDLLNEKTREDDLRAAGWSFVRITAELFADVPRLAKLLTEPD